MQVKSIAECSKHSAILLTFIKLPFVIKIFIVSIFEWPFYTGFTGNYNSEKAIPFHSLFYSMQHLIKEAVRTNRE